jgi:hypothetical protein
VLNLKFYLGNVNATNLLASWGLQLDAQSVELNGRIVDREIIVTNSGEIDSGQNADWGAQLTRGSAFDAV